MAEAKEYLAKNDENGSVAISDDVIAAIAGVAAAEVEGIASLGSVNVVDFIGKKNAGKGVKITMADDAVEIKKTGAKTIVGSAPDNIRHFIELRGIGIINARRIFGMGAVKLAEKIDMVIELEPWDSDKVYDRMGLDTEYIEILGIKVPHTVVPVQPGRNLAIIIEVAAMNNRQKRLGFNAAEDLNRRILGGAHSEF